MAGTKSGSVKAVKTIYTKYGVDYFTRIGAKGGAKGHTGGFYVHRDLARIAGAIGGCNGSRRGVPNRKKLVAA